MVIESSGPASTSKSTCCGCFQQKRKRTSITLLEIYNRSCIDPEQCAQRAPLGPLENICTCKRSLQINNLLNESEYEVGKEKVSINQSRNKTHQNNKEQQRVNNANYTEFEFADDAISLNNDTLDERPPSRNSLISNNQSSVKNAAELLTTITATTDNPYINVNGKEELPQIQEIRKYQNISSSNHHSNITNNTIISSSSDFVVNDDDVEIKLNNHDPNKTEAINRVNKINNKNFDGNYNKLNIKNIYSYCTLPKNKKNHTTSINNTSNNHQTRNHFRHNISPPKRITPDGTHIYYWCDLYKKGTNGKTLLRPVLFKLKILID